MLLASFNLNPSIAYRINQALVDEKKAAVRAGEASIEKGKGKDLLSMVGEFRHEHG